MSQTTRNWAWSGAGMALTAVAGLATVFLFWLPGCSQTEPAAKPGSHKQNTPTVDKAGENSSVKVKVVRPAREHLKRVSTPQPAHIDPYEKTDIYAKVAGYLEALGEVRGADGKMRPVDIGDRVAKDQVLVKLSIPEMEQERLHKAALVEQAQAEVGQAEASIRATEAMIAAAQAKVQESQSLIVKHEAEAAFRKVEHDRHLQLFNERAQRKEVVDEKFNQLQAAHAAVAAAKATVATAQANLTVEQARLIKAKADVHSAKARLKVAQANLEHAIILIAYGTIKAPYEGVVTRRVFDTGAFVQSAVTGKPEPLFTLARVDRLRIIADIPEAEAGLVKIGQPATLRVDAARGQTLNGKVVRFADALDASTRTMRTEVELDAPNSVLRPGMFGSLTIMLADFPDALMLPTSTLSIGGKPAVFVVEDGRVRRREIELGLNDGGRMQVLRGLTGGEQVIADGKGAVREGQTVVSDK